MSDLGDRTRETRLRRMAERQGLVLTKSRRRDPRATDYGEYYLTDAETGVQLAGYSHSMRDLDAVEFWLATRRARTGYSVEIETPEYEHEIGPVASPADLAYPLAHVLVVIEKHGLSQPPFTLYAALDGQVRDPTVDERQALDTELERALAKIRSGNQDQRPRDE